MDMRPPTAIGVAVLGSVLGLSGAPVTAAGAAAAPGATLAPAPATTPASVTTAATIPTNALARAVEFRFTPTARAQIALWIENADGTFMGTVRLTQAVGVRGIGNRPGASQMNSGFRWPYGRRLDALPIWAHRRAAAPGAAQFKPVIFQHRTSEGCASNAGCGGSDSSTESYFCLSFKPETTRQDALDAVSCASVFSSDKGRYLTADDVAKGYAEPAEIGGMGTMRQLDPVSLYPPRRDGAGCGSQAGCIDHPDAATYASHARTVMPELDAVTMATPPADQEQVVLFTIPDSWNDSEYVAWIEVNVEGDHNDVFSAAAYATPQLPAGAWDSWAVGFGYPYRGQPSVVFKVPFSLQASAASSTSSPSGYGDVDGFGSSGGQIHPMDGTITDDVSSPATMGSGADRLRLVSPRDYRFQVNVQDMELCQSHAPPETPAAMNTLVDPDEKHSHEWGHLQFLVPKSERRIDHYEVRYSKTEISASDSSSFAQALPVMAAQTDSVALSVPTSGSPGSLVDVRFGGMEPLTKYWIGLRAVDACNVAGPYAVSSLTTTRINFTQLSGCFIATAAYGSALQPEVGALRAARDALRPRSPVFAAATDLYYRSGPAAAAVIARSDVARAVVRSLIGPVAQLAKLAPGPPGGGFLPRAHVPRGRLSPPRSGSPGLPDVRSGD